MWLAGAITLLTSFFPRLGAAVEGPTGPNPLWQAAPEARIWLDRGSDPVVMPGDRVRIYYRSNVDAYVAILQIDADGTVRLLYPRSPTENYYARAERDYRLLFPRSAYWNVDDRPGIGYFFVVTSPKPFDLSDFRYSHNDGGWDLSLVGSTVYTDPYVAIDEYVARLIPDWEYADYGLDFASYQVGEAHDYPRFLCYQCHGFRPYVAWNPYRYTCTDFRVVVYDDPYFYPSRRYRGRRVVYAVPRSPRPRFAFKERAPGEPGTVIVTPVSGDRRPSGTSTRNLPPSSSSARVRPPRTRDADIEARRVESRVRVAPPVRAPEKSMPTLRRRPSTPGRKPPSEGGGGRQVELAWARSRGPADHAPSPSRSPHDASSASTSSRDAAVRLRPRFSDPSGRSAALRGACGILPGPPVRLSAGAPKHSGATPTRRGREKASWFEFIPSSQTPTSSPTQTPSRWEQPLRRLLWAFPPDYLESPDRRTTLDRKSLPPWISATSAISASSLTSTTVSRRWPIDCWRQRTRSISETCETRFSTPTSWSVSAGLRSSSTRFECNMRRRTEASTS